MASNGAGKYEEMIGRVASEYAALRAEQQAIAAERVEAAAELAKLQTEAAELRSRLADFEAGAGDPMTAQEFQDASYRVQWLAGAVRAQQRIADNAAGKERAIGFELTGLHGRARNDLENMLKADYEATAEARRAELAAALGSNKAREWAQPPKISKVVEVDRF